MVKAKEKTKTVKKGKAQKSGKSSEPVVERPAAAMEPRPAKMPTKPETDEERKARKNAYVREWRKTHKDQYASYMKEWRAKKDAAAGKKSSTPKKKGTRPAKGKTTHNERSDSASNVGASDTASLSPDITLEVTSPATA